MQARQHQCAARPEHAAQLAQRGDPVIDVLDGQRAQGQVDAVIGQPAKRVSQVVHPELAARYPAPGDVHHAGAVVEPGHSRAAAGQFRGIQSRAAGRVKNPLASDIAKQRQARRAVVVGVENPDPAWSRYSSANTSY
jgi:hypothetical protein